MDGICKESIKIQDKGKQVSKESLVRDFSSSTNDILNVKNNMKVIPIVGMGGIGKTTLAKEVYNHEAILCRFDVRAWATVSQQHNIKEILLNLLQSTIKMDDTVKTKGEAELKDILQKSLKRKRYLIVLDDIWSCEVWDGVRRCFPTEDNAGSRILLTTRNDEVACYAGIENLSLWMSFMDQDESWSLFKSAAFSKMSRVTTNYCRGCRLLKSKRTIEDWKSVAKDVKSFITHDLDEQCSRVLGLSYNHLTSDLKAYLLHFGIFPEDSEIPVTKLMRLWMAEGFLNLGNDMEGEAEKCLQDLVDRYLVLVSKRSRDETKIRSYDCEPVHVPSGCQSLSRMCLIMFEHLRARKAKSLSMHKMNPFKCRTREEMYGFGGGFYRALLTPVHHQLRDYDNNDILKQTRSIFFYGRGISTLILKSELTHLKLLKVLDVSHVMIDSFPLQILSLIWLRYLSLFSYGKLDIPPEICRLWNLQTFIVQGMLTFKRKAMYGSVKVTFPEEIWGLMQLRHLKQPEFYLPNPPSVSADKGSHVGFSNIQTISYLCSDCYMKEVILGIQNAKELGIIGNVINSMSIRDFGLHNNLVYLQQLETLSFSCCQNRVLPASAKAFPATLKKLKLDGTFLNWSYLDIIAELPNLEVLKLMDDACDGDEWHQNVKGFTLLKLLLIEDNHLKYWKATDDNFPVLELLMIRSCKDLKEIPIEFAEIHTLQLIELRKCSPKLGESAA
ncbi:hypothetical protein P3L10_025545 [Capsicum annuum]